MIDRTNEVIALRRAVADISRRLEVVTAVALNLQETQLARDEVIIAAIPLRPLR